MSKIENPKIVLKKTLVLEGCDENAHKTKKITLSQSLTKSTTLLRVKLLCLKSAKEQLSLLRQLTMLFIASNLPIPALQRFPKLSKQELNMWK